MLRSLDPRRATWSATQASRRCLAAGARAAALEPDLAALDERFGARARSVLDDASAARSGSTARDVWRPLWPRSWPRPGSAGSRSRIPPTSGSATSCRAACVRAMKASGPRWLPPRRSAGLGPARNGPRHPASRCDLVLSTDGYPVDPHLRVDLQVEPRPLLVTGVWSSRAVIGPLVVPGRTSCLHCADLHRCDRDPAWPVLSAQLAGPGRAPVPSEVAVCTLTAAITAVAGAGVPRR